MKSHDKVPASLQAPERREMETFIYYVPKVSHAEHKELSIANLIPFGRENAISRELLTAKCLEYGLIQNSKDNDRRMRLLISKARIDYTILNRADDGGYYRPTKDDLLDLERYIRQEENRAVSVFKSIKTAKALYEDYKAGRLSD